MNPLLLAFLSSFGPGLLARLFGGDSNARLRREAGRISSPQNYSRLTNQYFQQALGSPAYSQALGTIAAGANAASNNVARNLAQAGIGSTGTGAVLSGLTPSLVGSQRAGLTSAAYGQAGSQAEQDIARQLQVLLGTTGPSYSGQLFGGGLDAFGKFLQLWLMQQGQGRQQADSGYAPQGRPV